MRVCLLLTFVCAAYAGNPKFNGRWDITGHSETAKRAWWLEINGAGTASPSGKFVTAFNGDMNVIQEIAIDGDTLQFGWRRNAARPDETPRMVHMIYKAKLVGDKLEGTFENEGQQHPPLQWTGVRAPAIADRDDGTWREGAPVKLFNGKDLTGWKLAEPDRPSGWSVVDGCLASPGGRSANLISEQKFWNFKLHLEYKVAAHSNSGVGLRARYEVQILEDYGRPAGTHSNGALYARIAPAENASKPADEWQAYDIRLVGRQVTVVLNGKKLIDKGEIEGLTAIAVDSNEAEPGAIYLQGDHGTVQFRNMVVTPLVK